MSNVISFSTESKQVLPGDGWSDAVDTLRHSGTVYQLSNLLRIGGAIAGVSDSHDNAAVNLQAFVEASVPPLNEWENEQLVAGINQTAVALGHGAKAISTPYQGATHV